MQSNLRKERRKKHIEDIEKKLKDPFDVVFHKMTQEEKLLLWQYTWCGFYMNDTVFMGYKSFKRLNDYKQEMTNKYNIY